jgi:hypothetical protein
LNSYAELLVRLAKLPEVLEGDEELELRRRQQRDRAIGLRLRDVRPWRQVCFWLDEIAAPTVGESKLGAIARAMSALAFVSGAGVGAATAAVVFEYDGSRPVNVVYVLAVLVLAQLGLIVLLGVMLLPGQRFRLLRGVQDLLSVLSPGRWLRTLSAHMGRGAGLPASLQRGSVAKWLALYWSQSFAMAFNAAAIGWALILIVTSDLAFGWSTTLQFDAQDFARWVQMLATPWAALLPDAVPGEEMIAATRYFRLDEGGYSIAPTDVSKLGAWWPFLIASLVFYGLIPRVIFWLVARWRLRRALITGLLQQPLVPALLDRMNQPCIDTRAEQFEALAPEADRTVPLIDTTIVEGQDIIAINWADAVNQPEIADRLQNSLSVRVIEGFSAGGTGPPAQDEALVDRLRRRGDGRWIVVLVKAWEPPMLECLEFLRAVRDAWGGSLLIAGVSLTEEDQRSQQEEAQVWRRRLAELSEPLPYWCDI